MKPAIFLDRDNTLIENDGDLGDPDGVKLIKGAASAVASLRGLGFTIVVVTNQGGVARGRFGESDVDAVNQRLNELIKTTTRASVDRFYYCPYHPDGSVEQYRKEHSWRKPKPGMILQAVKDLKLDLGRSWMIGDQIRDVQAGQAAGVRTILLRPGAEKTLPGDETEYRLARADDGHDMPGAPTYVAPTLAEAVKVVAQMPRPERALDMTGAAVLRGRGDGDGAGHTPSNGEGGRGRDDGGARAVRSVDTRPRRVVMRQAVEVAPPSSEEGGGEEASFDQSAVAVVEAAAETMPANETPLAKDDDRIDGDLEGGTSETGGGGSVGVEDAPVSGGVIGSSEPESDPSEPVVETGVEASEPAVATDAAAVDEGVSGEADQQVLQAGIGVTSEEQGEAPAETVLRQILQELRCQRQVESDFSYLHVVAITLQMIAVMCLLGALWLGGENLESFVRWIMAAMVLQIATVAALLFKR